jgi:Putative prokaryotic signal transducing protein
MIHIPEGEAEVLRVQGHINAAPIVAALRANGIAARLVGEALGSVYGLTLDGLGEVAILVAAEDAERARDLLAAADRRQLEVDEESIEPSLANLGPRPPED